MLILSSENSLPKLVRLGRRCVTNLSGTFASLIPVSAIGRSLAFVAHITKFNDNDNNNLFLYCRNLYNNHKCFILHCFKTNEQYIFSAAISTLEYRNTQAVQLHVLMCTMEGHTPSISIVPNFRIFVSGGEKILLAAGGSLEPFWQMYSVHKNPQVIIPRHEM